VRILKIFPATVSVLALISLAVSSNEWSVGAADTTVVITEASIARQPENTEPTKNWVLYSRSAGNGTFRNGPATPAEGIGSIELITPTGADKVTLFNFDHTGVHLSSIQGMGYSTYRLTGALQQVTAMNLQVDVNGDAEGGFTTLVFEPVYNTGQGSVTNDTWQDWDAYNEGNAIWWSSNPIPGAPNRDTFVSWNTLLENNPEAVIIGGFGLNQGSGNPALQTAADALSIKYEGNTTTYDFELYMVATNKNQCKNGGWSERKRADGTPFANQGDCVSYVNIGN
jgi:hypothetical protein